MAHRQDLNALSAAERQQLVDLMLDYLNDEIVADHMSIIHSNVEIFTGHRAYIASMEAWLSANGGSQFVPLPYWNSANPIPPEFNVVKPEDDGTPRPPLGNLNPAIPKPAEYEYPAVCDFEDPDDLGNAINGWHGMVHCTVGGTMCMITIASAAPIFWCWHAFVDHIYWDWQKCTVICPDVVGYTLPFVRNKLRVAGLRVGSITRLPKFAIPIEKLPFPFPRPEPDPEPFVRGLQFAHDEGVHAHASHTRSAVAVLVGGGGHSPASHGNGHGDGGHGDGGDHGGQPPVPPVPPGLSKALREWRQHMSPGPILRGPYVIDQYPAAGVSVKHGSAVDLTVLAP